jgi:uncharacterized protein (TIGR03435 family)
MPIRSYADACCRFSFLYRLSAFWKWQVAVVSLTFLIGLLNAPPACAQSPAESSEFEVASIKINARGGSGAYVQALPGRLVMANFSLRSLIIFAYGVKDYQISGDPPWISSDRYDVQAKAEGNASVKKMEGSMLQRLLEDRFKLVLHRETRQLPVFELTVAKDGAKLERSKEGGCIPYSVESPPPLSPARGDSRPTFCGFPRLAVDGLNRTLEGAGVSVAELAMSLSRSELRRTIINKTGLAGTFDVHLKWTVDATTGTPGLGISDHPGTAQPPADPGGPSIFTALKEQLGLKLDSTKGPVEVLVVDHVEKLSAN